MAAYLRSAVLFALSVGLILHISLKNVVGLILGLVSQSEKRGLTFLIKIFLFLQMIVLVNQKIFLESYYNYDFIHNFSSKQNFN